MRRFLNTLDKVLDYTFKVGVTWRLGLTLGILWLVLNFALSVLYSPPVKVIRHDLPHVVTYNYYDDSQEIYRTKCEYYTNYKKKGDYYHITLENGSVIKVHKSDIIKLDNENQEKISLGYLLTRGNWNKVNDQHRQNFELRLNIVIILLVLELVLIPFVVCVATEVVADWLIQHINDKGDKHQPEFFREQKKTVVAATVFFLRFAIRFLELQR